MFRAISGKLDCVLQLVV